jgi:hypothetical protein
MDINCYTKWIEDTMNRLLGIAFLYLAMMLGWIGVGLFMLVAPARFGNLVHDSLLLFPEVRPGDWGKKTIVRILGIGLIAFAIRFVLRLPGY